MALQTRLRIYKRGPGFENRTPNNSIYIEVHNKLIKSDLRFTIPSVLEDLFVIEKEISEKKINLVSIFSIQFLIGRSTIYNRTHFNQL